MNTPKIFENTKTAFVLKSDAELDRAIFIFRTIGRPWMVNIGTSLTMASLKLHLPVEGLIKKTIFNQFCGGTSTDECILTVKRMHTEDLYSILDYSVEGKATEKEFEATAAKKIELVELAAQNEELPFAVFKPTGIGRFAIWQKVSEREHLSPQEQQEWQRIRERVDRVCKAAHDHDVRLLVDGEESWMQDAADELVHEMMERYNKEKAIIYNTVQCYRWDRLAYIKNLHRIAKEKGFIVGAKIVRGAYMEKENERAEEKGYKTPICESKQASDQMFNQVMAYIIQHIGDIHLFVGSHNEESAYLAMDLMNEAKLAKNDDRIWFGQLYGMSEHMSYNLAQAGYNAAKLVPFGPVKDVIPYLIRRAQENTSVKGQTGRELSLLLKEKKRRKQKKTQ
ncbi:proline dehydrogenase family protein [Gangjinia marincola]|uniref:Proline dehydrogenase family protein n=1 Tax=Gangjinia marincola TaxID=578463 RepID=A0ABP3XRY2_9FLAO